MLFAQPMRVTNNTSCSVGVLVEYGTGVGGCSPSGTSSATLSASGGYYEFPSIAGSDYYLSVEITTGPAAGTKISACGAASQNYTNCNSRASKIFFVKHPHPTDPASAYLEEL